MTNLAVVSRGAVDKEARARHAYQARGAFGPVEGHVNRLKLLKRQGYGRAGVGLLRQRVTQAV